MRPRKGGSGALPMSRRVLGLATAAMALGLALGKAQAESAPQATLRWVTLGTAGGPIPQADRGQPANALRLGHTVVLADCGDGTAGALARAGIALPQVRAVVLSHLHQDHSAGLHALVGLRLQTQVPGKLKVLGPPGTRTLVDGIVQSLRPFAESTQGLPGAQGAPDPAAGVEVQEISDGDRVELEGLQLRARSNTHYSFAPGSALARQHLSLSFRFEAAGRSIVYTGDTGPSAAVEELAQGADLLVSEMIDVQRTVDSVRSGRPDMPPAAVAGMQRVLRLHHLAPEDVGQLAQRAGVKSLVVTHLVAPGAEAADLVRYVDTIRSVYAGPVRIAAELQEH